MSTPCAYIGQEVLLINIGFGFIAFSILLGFLSSIVFGFNVFRIMQDGFEKPQTNRVVPEGVSLVSGVWRAQGMLLVGSSIAGLSFCTGVLILAYHFISSL